MDPNNPLLTIIIPAYNEERRLPTTLPQVVSFAESQNYPVEVLVVDNASADGSPEAVEAVQPPVRLIANEENLGFSKANNAGWRASTAPAVLFLNSDAEVFSQRRQRHANHDSPAEFG